MTKIRGKGGSTYTVDEVISETDGKAIVRIGKKTVELATADKKPTPVAKHVADAAAGRENLNATQAVLKARVRGEANREFVRDNTTPALRTAAEASYQDQLEKEDASDS